MKIVFLSFYSGVVYRGVETYVHELAERLFKLGHDVTVYQNGAKVYGGSYKTVSIGIKFKVFEKGNLAILLNHFTGANADRKFSQKVLKLLDKDTDIVVATNNRFQAFLCRAWCLFKKTKLVIPGQGGPGFDERLALLSFPDAFIPLSEFQRSWAKRANPFVNVSGVIHNGVTLTSFSGNYKKIDFGLKGKIVLCAAALWTVMKRQHLLIKAVSKLDNVSLLLAGDGEEKESLEKMGRKYLGDRFLIKSFKYDEMPEVYASCDLFSFPTWPIESFGIVMVEAMASGLPVVASNDPIRREIVGDAGIFVDPRDTESYAKALQKALDSNWGDKPKKQAEKFSWDKIGLEYENLFKTLLKK
ncbi:MAG TPA: glycosyltransferase family 4 protein [Patescibacteria group bacterium]|nr:glycosyltransferase family 4 protein [Patescibacteria group bacterium]